MFQKIGKIKIRRCLVEAERAVEAEKKTRIGEAGATAAVLAAIDALEKYCRSQKKARAHQSVVRLAAR
jgi:hypothetical protein